MAFWIVGTQRARRPRLLSRLFAAALIANLAAPCVLLFLIYVQPAIVEPTDAPGLDWAGELTVVAVTLPMFWLGMAFSIFPLSLIFALTARALGCRWWLIFAATGAAFGAGTEFWLLPWFFGPLGEGLELTATYALVGAVCGWIYWRISLSNRSERDDTAPAPESRQ